ncbi:sensor histidine kinase [Actinomadura verrucosospora]|uniref:histidine kinase n=1 Tax=Actinomadura verrucosospora TaxID=46165 RepID=A0A7D3ZYK9_ACTVE|nr:HAMP domain-containing sensor histidine kinase [Actinomadura verrucosospora]QKG21464.1 signal transduction histidine kinase-like protein [Actinomadura verrucosospora]
MRVLWKRLSPSCWSVRTRITAAATLMVGLVLVAGIVVFYTLVQRTVYGGLHQRGDLVVDDLVTLVRQTDPHGLLRVEDPDFSLLQVLDQDGRVIAYSDALRGRRPLKVPSPTVISRAEDHIVHAQRINAEVYVVEERIRTPFGFRTVYAGAPLTELTRNKGAFIGLLAGAAVTGTALVAWIVAGAVRRALRPVRKMSDELADITGGEPGRVTVPDAADEVSELAQSVNLTLHRLEGVMERQRGFVGDVSHELRSPLTGLRTQLELALQDPEDEDWPAVARAALADADRLQGIVTDLLILAKLGAGVHVERERVDFGALVRAEAARRDRRVPVEIDAPDGIGVRATPEQLVRLLTNLLDNAERHARTRIWVTAARDGPDAVLEVRDDGSGIPPEDRERIFWRFQRLAEGRRRDKGGTGLGLTISRDIARAHGGTLVAADNEGGGARFVLRIPAEER